VFRRGEALRRIGLRHGEKNSIWRSCAGPSFFRLIVAKLYK
jgi:hypothetical protein